MGTFPNDGVCTTQTFCKVVGQAIKDQPNAQFYTKLNLVSKDEIITSNDWNIIYDVLKNLYKYGKYGTRTDNPDVSSLIYLKENQVIPLDQHNDILRRLGKNGQTLSEATLIKADLINTIQNYVDNYQLNADRCPFCNVGCEYSCQKAYQEGCELGQGCWMGGSGSDQNSSYCSGCQGTIQGSPWWNSSLNCYGSCQGGQTYCTPSGQNIPQGACSQNSSYIVQPGCFWEENKDLV